MKPLSIEIIPAQPGFLTVWDFKDRKEIATGEPVIAWRIETYSKKDADEVFSSCSALTADGELAVNCIGVQNPDMTITVFDEGLFSSVEELQTARYEK